jgi:hypothetical protein
MKQKYNNISMKRGRPYSSETGESVPYLVPIARSNDQRMGMSVKKEQEQVRPPMLLLTRSSRVALLGSGNSE